MRLLTASLVFTLALPASALAADDIKLLAVDPAKDHIRGDKNATASMVVYSDFQCPFCRRFHVTVEQVRKAYPKLRIVYRNFPLASIHPLAVPAARAAECVAVHRGNDAYWAFIDAMFEEEMTALSLRTNAVAQGMSETVYDACITDDEIDEKIATDLESGRLAGVQGTPSSFLVNANGTAVKITGAVPFETLDKRLKTFQFEDTKGPSARIQTTKRKARVRATVPGIRRWK